MFKLLQIPPEPLSLHCLQYVELNHGGKVMAQTINETPILFGEDARRFEARMREIRKETPQQRRERLYHYEVVKQWFENGRRYEEGFETENKTSEGK